MWLILRRGFKSRWSCPAWSSKKAEEREREREREREKERERKIKGPAALL